MTRAAFGAVRAGLISLEDGEVVRASKNKAIKKENSSFVNNLIKNDVAVKNALYVCVMTKVNYWETNHHITNGMRKRKGTSYGLSELIKDVTKNKMCLSNEEINTPEWANAIHTAGHWLSTKIVLSTLGVKGISPARPIFNAAEHAFKVTACIRERIESISADIKEPLAYYHPGARYLTGKKGKFNSKKATLI